MFNTKQNYHHSKLPKIGSLVKIANDLRNHLDIKPTYQVIAYPLCDNVLPYSKGIHTVYIRNLANNRVHRVSGFWLNVIN